MGWTRLEGKVVRLSFAGLSPLFTLYAESWRAKTTSGLVCPHYPHRRFAEPVAILLSERLSVKRAI